MSKRILTAVAVLGAAGFLAGCSFQQPSAGCIVQDSSVAPWQAKYTPKTAADGDKACGQLKGETLGVWKYTNVDPKTDEIVSSQLAIRPESLAAFAAGLGELQSSDAEKRKAWQLGTVIGMLAEEPANDFCGATNMRVMRADDTESAPQVLTNSSSGASLGYEFTAVEVYSKPDAPGTQLRGELRYTKDGCTAEYLVDAIWPQVACVPGSTDPVENCGEGSGLNPDFAAVCDADLEHCVPSKRVPSFK